MNVYKKELIVLRCLLFVLCSLLFFGYSDDASAFEDSGTASFAPWSGHYWPFRYGGLATGLDYRGHPAPLEKYLLLTTGKPNGPAIQWYTNEYYNPNAEGWWGLCPAYARAAVKETYPVYPSSKGNIVFRVGDKKGLLTLLHDKYKEGAVRYASGPKDFHVWLLDYIGDQKKAFAADLGSESEVWYYPIYAYEMQSSRAGMSEDVTVTISHAVHMKPDYMGTETRQKTYTYQLGLNAAGDVVSGRWTGNSITTHPKTLSYPEATEPLNPYLDAEKIREIAQERDDEFELKDNAPARLVPGTHNLVLLNDDIYILQGEPGDMAKLDILRQQGSLEPIQFEITDNRDVVIHQETLTQKNESMNLQLVLKNPPYTIRITQENYLTDPNIYSIVMDFENDHVRQVPYIPKNGPWSGFAITNASDHQAAEIMLVTTDHNGQPLHTVMGPLELPPGQKHLVHFSSLPVRKHELPETESLKIISDHPVEMVNLFADTGGPMAGFSTSAPVAGRLIIPDLYNNEPWDPQYTTAGVSNLLFTDTTITCDVYLPNGMLALKVSQNIEARGLFTIQPGSSVFSGVPDEGWMDIYADVSDNAKLTGYQYFKTMGNGTDALETNFALPVVSGIQYVQHVTPPVGPWQTWLTLINPNNNDNPVVIHPASDGRDTSADILVELAPFQKQVIDLSGEFGNRVRRSMLEISGQYPLAGQVRYAADQCDTVAYPLLDADSFNTELIMPHAPYNNGRWYTGVGVCNPNDYPVTVLIMPYDHSGEVLLPEGVDLTLAPGEYEVFTVHKMFPGQATDISFLKIHPMEPETAGIGGFYLYGNAAAQDLEPRKLVSGGNM